MQEDGGVMSAAVEVNRKMQVEKMLRNREIPFTVVSVDANIGIVDQKYRVHSPSIKPALRFKSRFDWKDYYPLDAVYHFMGELELQYPSKCSVTSIGKSVEGRDIKMLKISNSDAKNVGVWLDGTIHAREWISTSVVTYLANYIVRNFDALPKSVTSKDWYIVPIVNPDGYYYSHTFDRLWRKSRARHDNNIVGVDLNRNFGFCNAPAPDGTSGDPFHINYRGTEPFSEPETAAMKDLILYAGIPFKLYMTFHAYSEVIAFPWCASSEPCNDYVTLLEGGTIMAKAMYETTGKMYKVGAFRDIMYSAAGTSLDWIYGTAHIPFAYLVELRSKSAKFTLPKSEILDNCKEVLNGTLALLEYIDKVEKKDKKK